jgi:hypothetical protein
VLLRNVSDWSAAKKLGMAPGKSLVMLFIPDTHQSQSYPAATICHYHVIPLDKTPKILGVTWDTHFTLSPHARAIAMKATGFLCILKALTGTNWASPGRHYCHLPNIKRPIPNYAAPIWYPVASHTAVANLQTIQNTALRLATGFLKMAGSPIFTRRSTSSHYPRIWIWLVPSSLPVPSSPPIPFFASFLLPRGLPH